MSAADAAPCPGLHQWAVAGARPPPPLLLQLLLHMLAGQLATPPGPPHRCFAATLTPALPSLGFAARVLRGL